jgi:hypothetical protein
LTRLAHLSGNSKEVYALDTTTFVWHVKVHDITPRNQLDTKLYLITMPRGKNYVNNNKGVSLQANPKAKVIMKVCEYGAGCTRPDCIYRHEGGAKKDEVCLPFLAGKCTFKENGCRKRHPKKDEKSRLIAKYKRTRCRHGNDCFTDGCLYLHPREMEQEPSFVEPLNEAFPPLNDATALNVPKPIFNSAWKVTPLVAPPAPQPQTLPVMFPHPEQHPPVPMMHPPQPPMDAVPPPHGWNPMYGAPAFYSPPPEYFDPSFQHQPMAYYNAPFYPDGMSAHFNAEAKEFIPGNYE